MNRIKRNTLFVLVALTLAAALPATAAEGVVNINDAGIEQLSLLPRVGATVAQRIVDFRQENGAFKSPEDLLLVRGIGEATFELMAPHVTVSGPTTLTEKVSVPRAAASNEE
jgi:competence protein ComEA